MEGDERVPGPGLAGSREAALEREEVGHELDVVDHEPPGAEELVALVDTYDRFDPASAADAGVVLGRLFWVRGVPGGPDASPSTPASRHLLDRAIDRGLKALNLLLHGGAFGIVALDLADASPQALGRIPFTTWLRLHRVIEGGRTACLLVGPEPIARSSAGLTLVLGSSEIRWSGSADRARLADYLDDVREIERRIQRVESVNSTGEPRELPGAPIGVPDDFAEHVKLMFDLQALAFAADTTRVFAFKLGRDASNRVYPESGYKAAFHSASHHQDRDDRITEFAKINKYHVSMIPYFLDKLRNTPDGDSNLLENTLVIYGSPMGNSNVHNHKRCPLFLAGRAGGHLKGGLHLKAPDGTPMANVFLTLMHKLGLDDVETFGDSTGEFDLTSVPETTEARS